MSSIFDLNGALVYQADLLTYQLHSFLAFSPPDRTIPIHIPACSNSAITLSPTFYSTTTKSYLDWRLIQNWALLPKHRESRKAVSAALLPYSLCNPTLCNRLKSFMERGFLLTVPCKLINLNFIDFLKIN